MAYEIETMRAGIAGAYPGERWRNRCKEMPDRQVIAIYNHFLRDGVFEKLRARRKKNKDDYGDDAYQMDLFRDFGVKEKPMKVLDIGTKVHVEAEIIGIQVKNSGKVVYRINIPSFGNIDVSSDYMAENEEEKPKEKKEELTGYWSRPDKKRESLMCSNCHNEIIGLRPYRFCPECGAYMAGPKAKEE